MASTGSWKGHAKWCFHNDFNTSLSRYWKREKDQSQVQTPDTVIYMYKHTSRNLRTCSWLVCRLGLEGFHVSGGGGLKERGGGAEGGFWLLPASSPSPIVMVGCGGWADSLGRLDLAGAGGTGGTPLRPLHSSLNSLEEQTTKASSPLPLLLLPFVFLLLKPHLKSESNILSHELNSKHFPSLSASTICLSL